HAWLLDQKRPVVLTEMVIKVQQMMSNVYPELRASGDVVRVVNEEERRFHHTMEIGLEKLEQDLAQIRQMRDAQIRAFVVEKHRLESGERNAEAFSDSVDNLVKGSPSYSGDRAFKLYDTFGLPVDFIQDACRDDGIAFDQTGFDQAMNEQRLRARASWKGAAKQTANPAYQQ